jgi:hypothetical protein
VRQTSCLAARNRTSQRDHGLRRAHEPTLRAPERGGRSFLMLAGARERTVVLEEADDAAVLARGSELLLETRVQGNGTRPRPRRSRRIGRRP